MSKKMKESFLTMWKKMSKPKVKVIGPDLGNRVTNAEAKRERKRQKRLENSKKETK